MEPAPTNPDEFDKLRKLLALKRHEEPPPGYFDRLPGEIRTRIAHAEAHPAPLWRRWLAAFDFSPALATSYAAVVVVLVLGGVWLAQRPGTSGSPQVVTAPVPKDTNQNPALVVSNPPPAGLFNPPSLQVQPASAPQR